MLLNDLVGQIWPANILFDGSIICTYFLLLFCDRILNYDEFVKFREVIEFTCYMRNLKDVFFSFFVKLALHF